MYHHVTYAMATPNLFISGLLIASVVAAPQLTGITTSPIVGSAAASNASVLGNYYN